MVESAATGLPLPDTLQHVAAERVIVADVREELRAGREPFRIIMEARERVAPDGALCVRAIFEPAPLYNVLGRQGFAHVTEQLAPDDWAVWFYRESAVAKPDASATATPTSPTAGDEQVVVLDVRGLEAPEPMVRTLAALETLPAGATLVQLNVRVPQFLLPELEARGFTYEIREQDEDLVRIFIRRAT